MIDDTLVQQLRRELERQIHKRYLVEQQLEQANQTIAALQQENAQLKGQEIKGKVLVKKR